MSFWGTIAKIGGFAAAPFTGGASIPIGMAAGSGLDAISPAGEIGETAGNIESPRMNALIAQAKLGQEQDANQIAKNKSVLDAPHTLARNAVQGDVLAHAQDVNFSGLPSYINVPQQTGGLRPSLFSAATRNLGSQMSTKANADMASGTYTNPALTPLPEASAFDKVLQGTSLAGGFLNAARGLLPKIPGSVDSGIQLPDDWLPTGPPDPDDPWNGDPARMGGG